VLGAARNVACAGGRPLGLTDCLNFGNPEKPAIAAELADAIDGIARAAEALRIPVVSAAPLLTLAHDVGDQGLEAALAEAALWSGCGAQIELPEEPVGGAAVLACAPGDVELLGSKGLRVIGAAGGDELLGFSLGELRKAYG
jgi:phosphoribosylformylglycinamidine (FGAM) synthase-like enzyme